MIQITKGTFGYYNGRKIVPITSTDGPQQFDPELEERLVKEGVAKYVDGLQEPADPENPDPAGAPVPEDPTKDGQPEGEPETPEGDKPEYSEDMKLDELKEIAEAYGIDASAMRKKADVIAAIEAAKADGTADDDEEPPQIGAADPI